jgi:hypothetical protein
MECRQWRIWSRNFERFMEPDVQYHLLETLEVVIILSRVDLFERSFCTERYVLTGTNGKCRQLFKFTHARSLARSLFHYMRHSIPAVFLVASAGVAS